VTRRITALGDLIRLKVVNSLVFNLPDKQCHRCLKRSVCDKKVCMGFDRELTKLELVGRGLAKSS
jgi:hypothetical protein